LGRWAAIVSVLSGVEGEEGEGRGECEWRMQLGGCLLPGVRYLHTRRPLHVYDRQLLRSLGQGAVAGKCCGAHIVTTCPVTIGYSWSLSAGPSRQGASPVRAVAADMGSWSLVVVMFECWRH